MEKLVDSPPTSTLPNKVNKNMKLKEQKNKCFHDSDFYYEDDEGDEHCEKCEAELKN